MGEFNKATISLFEILGENKRLSLIKEIGEKYIKLY